MYMADKWEYDYTHHSEEVKSTYTVDLKNVEAVRNAMNERGQHGWELVSVIPGLVEGTSRGFKCFWKRRV